MASGGTGQFSHQCGATLVSKDTVITAAHCVTEGTNTLNPVDFKVRLGEHNIERDTVNDRAEEIQVARIIVHPRFDPRTYRNDIAVLKLASKVSSHFDFSNRMTIALPLSCHLFRLITRSESSLPACHEMLSCSSKSK